MKKHWMTKRNRMKQSFKVSAAAVALALTAQVAAADTLFVGSAINNADHNRLVFFSSDNPSKAQLMQIKGLQSDERILGMDVRVADGLLYAVTTKNKLYTLDISGKVAIANLVGALVSAVDSSPVKLIGDSFGVDFNPTNALLRVVSDANQNLTINPLTAAVTINTSLNYVDGTTTDPGVACIMYNNNDNDPATATTLYDIDTTLDMLVTQTPPASGQLTTVGSLGVNTIGSQVVGCDIATVGGANLAYAAMQTPDDDRSKLYSVNLITGAATFIGKIGGPEPLMSLTILP